MGRREFIAALCTSLSWPLAAQAAMPVIGFLHAASRASLPDDFLAAYLEGLSETGYIESQNVAIEYRWAEGQNDRLPALAADLVRRQVAVIATPNGTAATLAAKAATQTIPIVFFIGSDPVSIGLVRSLNRPGGNVTGVVTLSVETTAKRLQLMHECVPVANLIAVLVNPANPVYTESQVGALEPAARVLGVRLLILNASNQSDIEAAFATLVRERAGALLITGDAFFTTHQDQIAALAARYAVPTIEQTREFAVAGGLMSYASDYQTAFHLVGNLTGRILKGEKPADLPVQQATKVKLILNMKTAKALGLTLPISLLGRADEVIE
jgi:putative tryptophan/tyrosine transport system substrate-binding protein